ncbi:MAG: MFS transporter [Candidatus Bathyarchaeota archaeon]|nr:MFS transporter [Candidatus Bathyarchaeota archaeon]
MQNFLNPSSISKLIIPEREHGSKSQRGNCLTTIREKTSGFSASFKILNRDLRLIFTSNLVGAFGDGLYAYLLPYYMTEALGASSVEVGALYALTSLTAALTLLAAGALADKYDRKKIMIAGWVAWIPTPLIFAFARNWVQMVPGMLLWGFWLGGPTSTAYIVTAADKDRLTLTFTVISSAWSLGYIFSPAVGGYIAGKVGMQTVFLVSFVLYTLATLILAFIRSQHVKPPEEEKLEGYPSTLTLLKTGKLVAISAFFAATMFVLMMYRPFVPKFLADIHNYGDFEIGVFGSIAFAGSAVLGIALGRLGDKHGKKFALAVLMMLCSFSLAVILLTGNFYLLALAFFLTGASYTVWSLMSAIIGPMAPEPIRARWISIPQTISMFASILAPYLGGVLYNTSPNMPFAFAIVMTVALTLITLFQKF